MHRKKKNIFLLLTPLLTVLVITMNFVFSDADYRILETSILSILRNIAEENAPRPADISVKSITLHKIADPTKDFNFSKYKSTIILTNEGGALRDARLIFRAGENQKNMLVKNTVGGFSLGAGESYVVRNYEFVFDGRYNGGQVTLQADVVDKLDYDKSNNFYIVDVFDYSPKITSISLQKILDDGTKVLDFSSIPFSIKRHDFEIMTSNDFSFNEDQLRYSEGTMFYEPYGYYRVKNSLLIVKGGFASTSCTELDSHFVSPDAKAVYIKATNPDNGYYAVSNVIVFPEQEPVTKAQFAKLFVEYADIELDGDGDNHYEDLTSGEWYSLYVQTLYNLGLLDLKSLYYFPEEKITRSEALKIALEYFDVDLVIGFGAPHFDDVGEENPIYPYVEAFYMTGKSAPVGVNFYPDSFATKNFIKYLTNEYRESR